MLLCHPPSAVELERSHIDPAPFKIGASSEPQAGFSLHSIHNLKPPTQSYRYCIEAWSPTYVYLLGSTFHQASAPSGNWVRHTLAEDMYSMAFNNRTNFIYEDRQGQKILPNLPELDLIPAGRYSRNVKDNAGVSSLCAFSFKASISLVTENTSLIKSFVHHNGFKSLVPPQPAYSIILSPIICC